MVPTSGNPARIYVCTTAGTSGTTEPTWPDSDNATVTDGTVTWKEATNTLNAGTFPAEVSGGSYARVAFTNNTTNFATPANRQVTNAQTIAFPVATATWGNVVMIALWDASSGGNAWAWSTLSPYRVYQSGDQLTIPANQFTVTIA